MNTALNRISVKSQGVSLMWDESLKVCRRQMLTTLVKPLSMGMVLTNRGSIIRAKLGFQPWIISEVTKVSNSAHQIEKI